MYHDALVEPAVVIHRNRRSAAEGAPNIDPTHRVISEYQLHRVVDFLLRGRSDTAEASVTEVKLSTPYMRAALQFPDELLHDSVAVTTALQFLLVNDPRYVASMEQRRAALTAVNSTSQSPVTAAASTPMTAMRRIQPASLDNPHMPKHDIRLFVLADNTFGSCCPDEITAQHYSADCIIHFGEACMSKSTRLPVFYVQDAFSMRACQAPSGPSGAASVGNEGCHHKITNEDVAAAPPSLPSTPLEAEVIVEVARRLAQKLYEYQMDWLAARQSLNCLSDVVVPRLTVVGAYTTRLAMEAAERLWKEREAENVFADSVFVDWPVFEYRESALNPVRTPYSTTAVSKTEEGCCCGGSRPDPGSDAGTTCCPTTQTNNASPSGAVEEGISCRQEENALDAPTPSIVTPPAVSGAVDSWVANGVRFHRIATRAASRHADAASPSAADISAPTRHEVQYFLFVSPTNAPSLVQVLAAEQYNHYHYTSEACQSFLGFVEDSTDVVLPFVCTMNNSFGEGAEMQLWDGEGDGCRYPSVEKVRRWVDVALGDHWPSSLCTGDYMEADRMLRQRVRQRSFNIESIRASGAIGILVASLAIEGYYDLTQQLHQLIRAYGKRSYIIYVGHLNEFKLANFVDTVDCFVAVACPNSRSGHFPCKRDNFMKPVVAPAEVLVALTSSDTDEDAASQYGRAAVYSTSIECSLEAIRSALVARRQALEERDTTQLSVEEADRWSTSGALVHVGHTSGVLTTQSTSQGALTRLYEREYIGLDPRVGETPVQAEIIDGKSGIARGYAKERMDQGL